MKQILILITIFIQITLLGSEILELKFDAKNCEKMNLLIAIINSYSKENLKLRNIINTVQADLEFSDQLL